MNIYEILKLTIEILKIVSWPLTVLIILLIFRKNLKELFNRIANIEGSLGSWNFKLQAKDELQKTVKDAIILEKEGRNEDAEKLISKNTEMVSKALGLSEHDFKYLLNIKEGKNGEKWGKIHLVNAGLINLEGSQLTEAGNLIVDRFLKYNQNK